MADIRPVFFFDIDNCLYPKSRKVHDQMAALIDMYFMKHLNLTQDDAFKLHQEYYKSYGAAIQGLVNHHKIDPMDYNRQVDDALDLDSIIYPDDRLTKLLKDIDTTKVKPWLFTNAYITHGKRVVRLLGIEDLFEGITYCDYSKFPILCKPNPEMFGKAMREAGVSEMMDCWFVDDSGLNCRQAEALGWNTTHLVEEGEPLPTQKSCKHQVRSLEELRTLFPQFFKSS